MFDSAPSAETLTELSTVVERLTTTDPSADVATGAEALGALWSAVERLTGAFWARLSAIENDGRWAASGEAATFPAWVSATTGLTRGAAAAAVRTARLLDEHLPTLQAGVLAGTVPLAAVRVIAAVGASTPTRRAALAEADPLFTDWAARFDHRDLSTLVHRWAATVDQDGVLRDSDAAYRSRYLLLSPNLDGTLSLDGRFDPEAGALLRTWLDAATGPATWTTADNPPPDGAEQSGPPGTDDAPRTMPQRRADALVALARRALDGGQVPIHAGLRPHLLVTTTEPTLRQAAAAAPLPTVDGATPAGAVGPADPAGQPVREPSWLHNGELLTAPDLARLACDATVTRALLGQDGEPLALGRATRTITPGLRKALILRDRGCIYPGCDRPWTWTDGHHVRHWADGGTTDLDNLVLLCRHHHRHVHRHRLRPVRRTSGDPRRRQPPHLHRSAAGWAFVPDTAPAERRALAPP